MEDHDVLRGSGKKSSGLLVMVLVVLVFLPVWSNLALGMLPAAAEEPLRAIERHVVGECESMFAIYDRVPALAGFYEWCFDRVY